MSTLIFFISFFSFFCGRDDLFCSSFAFTWKNNFFFCSFDLVLRGKLNIFGFFKVIMSFFQ